MQCVVCSVQCIVSQTDQSTALAKNTVVTTVFLAINHITPLHTIITFISFSATFYIQLPGFTECEECALVLWFSGALVLWWVIRVKAGRPSGYFAVLGRSNPGSEKTSRVQNYTIGLEKCIYNKL